MTRTVKRLLRAEKLISQLLEAWDASESGNVEHVLEKMRAFIAEI